MLWQSSTLMFRRGVCSSSGLLFLSFWMMLLMSVSVPGPAVAFGTQAFHRCRPEANRMVLVLDGVQPQGNDFPASVDSANFVTQGLLDFQYQPGCLNQSNGFTLQERGSNISQFIRFRCFSHIGSRVVTNTGLTKKAFLIVKKNYVFYRKTHNQQGYVVTSDFFDPIGKIKVPEKQWEKCWKPAAFLNSVRKAAGTLIPVKSVPWRNAGPVS